MSIYFGARLAVALALSIPGFIALADPPPWAGKGDSDDPAEVAADVGPPTTPGPAVSRRGHGRREVARGPVEPPKIKSLPQVPISAAPPEKTKKQRLGR